MKNRKLILAIDYNNISFRNMHTARHCEEGITTYDTEEECRVYGRYLIRDIISLTKLFSPSEVYLLTDSKDPWRREFIPEYKMTRKRDESINMQNIFNTMQEVCDVLRNYGVCNLSVDTAEADDLAAMLKTCMKREGSNVVFVTSDADWLQLVEFDKETTQFFVSYTPIIGGGRSIRPLCMTQECYDWVHSDVPVMGDTNMVARLNLIHALGHEKTMREKVIIPEDILLEKIVCGDDGDNVPTFFEHYSKSGKKVRVTPLKMSKLFECCGSPSNVSELESRVDDGSFKRAFKEALKWDVESVDFGERLNKQRMSVELNPKLFPKSVVKGFIDKLSTIDRSTISFRPNSFRGANDILKGTKFEMQYKTSNGAKLNSIFRTLVDKPLIKPSDL